MNKIMKGRLAGLLCFLMLFTSAVPTFAVVSSLGDYESHWAKDEIVKAMESGLVEGYSDGTFRPNNTMTRAEFMTIINNAYHFTEMSDMKFNDVSSTSWYASEVAKAAAAGYLLFDESGGVDPLRAITREEVAVMIAKVNHFEASSLDNEFIDDDQISDNMRRYVDAVSEKNIMNGTPEGAFLPLSSITRAEAIVTLNRALAFEPMETFVYDEAKVYGTEGYRRTIEGNVRITADGAYLKNMIIKGDLVIDESVGDGDVTLEDVEVQGATLVYGGGENSIHFINVVIKALYVDKQQVGSAGGSSSGGTSSSIRIVVSGQSNVADVIVRSPVKLQEESVQNGSGFVNVSVENDIIKQEPIVIELVAVSCQTIDIKAQGVVLDVDAVSKVSDLAVKAENTQIKGAGEIVKASVTKESVSFEKAPSQMDVGDNIKEPVVSNPSTSSGTAGGADTTSASGSSGGSSGGGSSSSSSGSNTVDQSGFTVALTQAGDKIQGTWFGISITGAKDTNGNALVGDQVSATIHSDVGGATETTAIKFVGGNSQNFLWSVNDPGSHVLTITINGVTASKTLNVTATQAMDSITPGDLRFINTDAMAAITVTELLGPSGNNMLADFVTDDGSLFQIEMNDNATESINVDVSKIVNSGTLLISDPSQATVTGSYALMIHPQPAEGNVVSWDINVMVLSDLDSSTIIFADAGPITKNIGDAAFTNTVTGGEGNGAITYTSDSPGVATVNSTTGEITIVGNGNAIITASKAATSTHSATTQSYTVNVGNAVDQSDFTIALTQVGDKYQGTWFGVSVTGAKDANGNVLVGDHVNASIQSNLGGGTETTTIQFVDGDSVNLLWSLMDTGDHTLTISIDGVTSSKTLDVTVVQSNDSITPASATFENTDANATITVTGLVASNGNNVLADFLADDGSFYHFEMNDDATENIDVTVTKAANSPNLVIADPSQATVPGPYALMITPQRVEGNVVSWDINVTVTSNLTPSTIVFADAGPIAKTVGDGAFTNTVTGGDGAGSITYTSGNTSVATVNTSSGEVTVVGAGSAVITAAKAATATHAATTNSYTVNVSAGADQSDFTVALTQAGNKIQGAWFGISITGAKDASGNAIVGDAVNASIHSNVGGNTETTTVKFVDGNSENLLWSVNDPGDHTLTITVNGVSQSKTLNVTADACSDVINPSTATFANTDASATITVTQLKDANGTTDHLAGFTQDDGTLYSFEMNDDATENINVVVTKAANSPDLVIADPSQATTAGTYALMIHPPQVEGSVVSWDIEVTVTSNLTPSTIVFADAGPIAKTVGDGAFTNTVTGGDGAGVITYTSANTNVATVNASSGEVTVIGAGSAVITAAKAATATHAATTNSYTVNVSAGGDQSDFTVALTQAGNKKEGTWFGLSFTGAKDQNGDAIVGNDVEVSISSNIGENGSGGAKFVNGDSEDFFWALMSEGTHTLTTGVAGVTGTKTLTVNVVATSQNITPNTATMVSTGPATTITVTALTDADGNNVLEEFRTDDGTLYDYVMNDNATESINVTVTKAANSADLVISDPSQATATGDYALMISRKSPAEGQVVNWDIHVTVTD